MGMFTPKIIAVTTTAQEVDLGGEASLLTLKNDGAGNALISFDNSASSSIAPLNAGETISFDLRANGVRGVKKLSMMADANCSIRLWGAIADE